MPVTSILLQEEKPNHSIFISSFRTEQCQDFLLRRCEQRRPCTCFNWHWPNQRRRKPILKRDGSFNYSPNEYCTQYNESTGICPNGDSCPYLHRNNGDTERNYHPRYYKTEMCFNVTRGGCIRGQNCIYAHSDDDIREPVYDVTERSNPAAAAAEIEKIAIENGHQTYPKSYATNVSNGMNSDGAGLVKNPTQSAMIQQQCLAHLRMDLDIANKRLETVDEEKRKLMQERDEAIKQLEKYEAAGARGDSFNEGRYLRSLHPLSSLDDLTVPLLQNIEKQLKSDLQTVRQVVLRKCAGRCLYCLERSASLRLPVCQHKVLCEVCYMKTNECPTCQAPIAIAQ